MGRPGRSPARKRPARRKRIDDRERRAMGSSKKITPRRIFVYVCSLAVLVLAKPHPVLYPVGLGFILAGEGLRVWACGHLRKNKDVIMSGPFAHVKNPLYVGTLMILVGFCLAASRPDHPSIYILYVGLPVFLLVFFFYYFPYKVRVEGDRLRRRFGEKFEEYDRNVPDLIPRLKPYRASDARWDVKLLSENSEYGTMIWVILGSIIVYTKFYFDLWS
jgi:protein-S-isoprenylcysteine O-methyltransferase Ste14